MCVHCGQTVGTFPYARKATIAFMWATCPCREAVWLADWQAVAAIEAAYRQQQTEQRLGDSGMRLVQDLQLATFDPTRLMNAADAAHPYTVATAWLAQALDYGPQARYRDGASPLPALYFYSPGKGRGKTHLAAGLAHAVVEQHKLVAFLQEHSYLERRWGCDLEELEQVSSLPGDRAWLTVIDDIGQRARASDAVADAWYAVFNRRWLKAGWTIITSNKTPDELVEQGTINDATYSRIAQMTGKRVITFEGEDVRLATATHG